MVPSSEWASIRGQALGTGRPGRVPLFDVYAGGQHLFTVALEDPPPDADELRVKVTQRGILAWNPNPEDFPRLHILSLRE